ncbi:MAG: CPBP family intramembrane metalloprotease [Methanomassiliicoccaceae archaeon]|nr:CPBP family intramembrane metalloprotease [Methanomassiliicoccaceae archaeon]
MNDQCPRCREYADEGRSFCGACGRDLRSDVGSGSYSVRTQDAQGAVPEKQQAGFVETVLLVTCIFVIFIAAFEAFTMVVNSWDIFSFLSDRSLGFFLLLPFPQVIFSLEGLALQIYWVLVAIVLLSCVAIAIWKFISAVKSSGNVLKQGATENTAAFWVCVFLAAMMFINFIITSIVIASGSDVTVPDFGDKIEMMFLLADAPFWEEIAARVLFIGLPMALISLVVYRKKESLRCLIGGFGMSTTAVVLIIISGAIFGMAHYSGWDEQWWKVLTAGIMGIFLGYMFVRFGLYASMLTHFVINYLSSFDWMGAGGFEVFMSLALIVVGFFALYYILKRLVDSKEAINALPAFYNGFIKK